MEGRLFISNVSGCRVEKMASFLKEAWEDLSVEELSRARGSFIAFTSGLEEGATREQFRAIMDPMLSIQDLVGQLKDLKSM